MPIVVIPTTADPVYLIKFESNESTRFQGVVLVRFLHKKNFASKNLVEFRAIFVLIIFWPNKTKIKKNK